MQLLSTLSLFSISGGYYSSHRTPLASPHVSISPVFEKSHWLGAYDTEGGHIAPASSVSSRCAVPPKNGDRNAQGQQYSWGTWWDDDH